MLAIFFALIFQTLHNLGATNNTTEHHPLVIVTWPFVPAANKAWEILQNGGTALDAVEEGCSKCEELQCDGSVGYGGSPDENGETTLDAMIMDGESHNVGAVGALREVKNAISVARKILEHTKHTFLVGSQATEFAEKMGFTKETLKTTTSQQIYDEWLGNSCKPDFWLNFVPARQQSCSLPENTTRDDLHSTSTQFNHDTIGMVAIDSKGRIAAGTSTNGARHKIPGRVGDSPIPGSGAYLDQEVGGAAATGHGDIMMRFLPSFSTVESMRGGMAPTEAAKSAIQRIVRYYPDFSGAVIASTIGGDHGAACHNIEYGFSYVLGHPSIGGTEVIKVECS